MALPGDKQAEWPQIKDIKLPMSSVESLSGLNAFVKAAQLGSFVAAAERLGVSASAIGKSVARLERSLGISLFNRSTRSLSMTEEGQLFFERSQRIVMELEEAEQELSRLMAAPRGRLRLSFPAIGYRLLLPLLPGFTARYPEIELDLDFNDRLVDVIGEGYDAVLRSGEFADSRLKARRLGGSASFWSVQRTISHDAVCRRCRTIWLNMTACCIASLARVSFSPGSLTAQTIAPSLSRDRWCSIILKRRSPPLVVDWG